MSKLSKWKKQGSAGKSGSKLQWIVIGGGLLLLIGVLFTAFPNSDNSGPAIGNIHWHATATLSVCGQPKPLPIPVAGEHERGLPLMHTHDDGRLHIEGFVGSPKDITLGKFMQAIGINFTSTQLFDKTNGNLCNGKPGKVVLLVNNSDNNQLADYSIQDGDKYDIRFE